MVLLCSANNININKNHILKCLNKKKENFNIFIIPLEKSLKEENTYINQNQNQNINMNINFDDKEIQNMFKDIEKIEK